MTVEPDFPAADVTDMLGSTVAAVRARCNAHAPTSTTSPSTPSSPPTRALLAEYIAAFESADAAAMQQILRRDAVIELPGSRTWFAGNLTCVAFLRDHALGAPGDWRMLPTVVNGQPAAAAYLHAPDGTHHAFGIAVLTTADDGIRRITVFNQPTLVGRCDLPATAPGRPV